MKGTGLLGFLPDEFLALLLAGAGIALILGFKRTAISLIVLVLITALSGPFVEALMGQLSTPVLLAVLAVVCILTLRSFRR